MLMRMLTSTATPKGGHHAYVGLVGLDPKAAHALTATLTTVCRSERPTEFVRRDRLGWFPLCANCHPTRVRSHPSPTAAAPGPEASLSTRRRRWGRLGALVLTWGLFIGSAVVWL